MDEIGGRHANDEVPVPEKKVARAFTFSAAAYNIIRIPKLMGARARMKRAVQAGTAPGEHDLT